MSNGWTREDTNLRDVLCGLYPDKAELRRIADECGVDWRRVPLDGAILTAWHETLKHAKLQRKRDSLLQSALSEYPDNLVLQQAGRGGLSDVRGTDIEKNVDWRSAANAPTLEKIMGDRSTLLPISFLETGLKKSQAVGRIIRSDGAVASGFLTGDNLLVTNNHVLKDVNEANLAKVQFNVQRTADGLDLQADSYDLNPQNGFKTSKDDDWTIVRVSGDAITKWGALPLVQMKVAKADHVIIIQHPGGGPKAIALYHNIVTFADASRVQYLTDTMPGSSGSPVFDDKWNVVAIHHSGGWLREPGSKQILFRNEGIAIERLLAGIDSI